MAIIWNKLIPRWGGDTIEPPEGKKDTGYIAGDKPPAKWENWLRKGTYEALDETRDVIESIDLQLAQKVSKTGDTMTGNLNVPTINSKTPAYAQTPTETVITSGFAAGWSGTIRYSKTQEGGLNLVIDSLLKTSDITNNLETVYTITDVNLRPRRQHKFYVLGATNTGTAVIGSLVEILIATNGTIQLRVVAGSTTNVRLIGGTQSSFM